ncbi:MAG TPA: glycosyltransferase family 1 protein [Candidatus Bilamarchaeum sp.]|nr:glycosyltransferase family 1 protein [Candidatus Bilamarchaeum sp.]
MKVTLVAHYLDQSVGHGIGRYSYNVYSEMERRGILGGTICSRSPFSFRGKPFLDLVFAIPARALLFGGKPDLYHFLEPALGYAISPLRRKSGKKVATTIYDLTYFRNARTINARIIARAIKASCMNSDMLIAISSLTKQDVVETFGLEKEKIRVTVLGADERFRPERAPHGTYTIGYIGRFDESKDVPFLLRAYSIFEKENPGSRLVLYGTGRTYGDCQKLAKELGLKNAQFMGLAKDSDLPAIYNSFDAFMFPSKAEGFGLPIIEAQKCRTPVIVRGDSKIPAEVTEFCLKAKDEAHAAQLMDEARKFRFSAEHEAHLSQFTWANCAEQTVKAYRELLE